MVSPVNMANRGETMLLRSKVLSRHRCLRPMQMGTAFLIRKISVRTRLHREQATAVRSSSFLLQDLLQGRECAVGKCALQKGRRDYDAPSLMLSPPEENCVHTTVNLRSFLSSPK
jgi:hypothetical protein